jgi:CheY-like chemotaxis protein
LEGNSRGRRHLTINKPVLIAEDDDNDLTFLLMAMKEVRLDKPIVTVRTGADAIAYLAGDGAYCDRVHFPFPCLMLLDIKMPTRDGFEVLAWWQRSKYPEDLPIIVLSGSDLAQDVETARSLGAAAYRIKAPNYRGTVELARELRDVWLTSGLPARPVISPEFFKSVGR